MRPPSPPPQHHPHQVEELMESCSGEIYVHHLWGYYFFLPGISFFPAGRWHLPHEDVHMLLLTIRRFLLTCMCCSRCCCLRLSPHLSSAAPAMHVHAGAHIHA